MSGLILYAGIEVDSSSLPIHVQVCLGSRVLFDKRYKDHFIGGESVARLKEVLDGESYDFQNGFLWDEDRPRTRTVPRLENSNLRNLQDVLGGN